MATKKKTTHHHRSVPTPAQVKKLERAHIKAENALRHAEVKVAMAKHKPHHR